MHPSPSTRHRRLVIPILMAAVVPLSIGCATSRLGFLGPVVRLSAGGGKAT